MKTLTKRVWIAAALLLLVALALAGCNTTGAETDTEAAELGEFSLVGVNWFWESMRVNAAGGPEETLVPNPSAYTIVFNEDGTLSGKADCNNYAGTYTQENGGVQITLGPTTAAACGEESLDTLFLQSLSTIVAGGPDGTGKLALESGGGERRMMFADGGAPPR